MDDLTIDILKLYCEHETLSAFDIEIILKKDFLSVNVYTSELFKDGYLSKPSAWDNPNYDYEEDPDYVYVFTKLTLSNKGKIKLAELEKEIKDREQLKKDRRFNIVTIWVIIVLAFITAVATILMLARTT